MAITPDTQVAPYHAQERDVRVEQREVFGGLRDLTARLISRATALGRGESAIMTERVRSGVVNGGFTVRFGDPGQERFVPDSLQQFVRSVYGDADIRLQNVMIISEKSDELGVDRVRGHIEVMPVTPKVHLRDVVGPVGSGRVPTWRGELALGPYNGVEVDTAEGTRIRGTTITFTMGENQTIFRVASSAPDVWEDDGKPKSQETGTIDPAVFRDMMLLVEADRFPRSGKYDPQLSMTAQLGI